MGSPVLSLKMAESRDGSSSRKYSSHPSFTLLFMSCVWSVRIRHITLNCVLPSNDFLKNTESYYQSIIFRISLKRGYKVGRGAGLVGVR